MGRILSTIFGWLGKAIAFPIVVLLVALFLWLPWGIIVILPLPKRISDRWTWALRRRFWNLIATAKFKGNTPKVIPYPGRLNWWQGVLVFSFGKALDRIGRVPFNRIFPGIPICNITVAGHEPADEWDAAMTFFTWLQVTLYRLFSPMQPGLPQIEANPYEALPNAYTTRHRGLFAPPVMPLEYQGSPDLGALAVKGPYAGYLTQCGVDHYEWNFLGLGARDPDNPAKDRYEHHDGLYNVGVRVLFQVEKASRTVHPVRIESELGVSKPGDATWEFAKKLSLCAATNHLSLVRHFLGIHLAGAAHVAIATRNHLFPDHPLGRLLWPYIFRTQSSNRAVTRAQMVKGGDFESIFSFTHTGMCRLFSDAYGEYRFIVNDPEREAADRGILNAGFETPTLDDLQQVFQMFYRHATRYVNLYYKTDCAIRTEQGTPVLNWLDELNDPHDGIPKGLPVTSSNVTPDRLARLLACCMYLVTVHHDIAGSFLWNYQLWAHVQPPRLYRNGQRLPLDVYQRLVNANFNLNVERTPLMNDYSWLASAQYGQQVSATEELARLQRTLALCEAEWRCEPWHVWRVYPSMLEANINA